MANINQSRELNMEQHFCRGTTIFQEICTWFVLCSLLFRFSIVVHIVLLVNFIHIIRGYFKLLGMIAPRPIIMMQPWRTWSNSNYHESIKTYDINCKTTESTSKTRVNLLDTGMLFVYYVNQLFFFFNVILLSHIVPYNCNIFVWNWSNIFSQHCGYWWPGALAPGHQ